MPFQRWYPRGADVGVPITPPKPWDQVRLGGMLLPCHHAVITAGGVELREDKKGGAGESGALPTYHGMDPKPITIDVYFNTVEQANRFNNMLPFFGPIPGIPTRVVSIEAQALAHLPITAVAVRAVGALLDAPPYKRITISCRHWLSSEKTKKKVTKTPTEETGNVRRDEAERAANPRPTSQAAFCAPNFTPGG